MMCKFTGIQNMLLLNKGEDHSQWTIDHGLWSKHIFLPFLSSKSLFLLRSNHFKWYPKFQKELRSV